MHNGDVLGQLCEGRARRRCMQGVWGFLRDRGPRPVAVRRARAWRSVARVRSLQRGQAPMGPHLRRGRGRDGAGSTSVCSTSRRVSFNYTFFLHNDGTQVATAFVRMRCFRVRVPTDSTTVSLDKMVFRPVPEVETPCRNRFVEIVGGAGRGRICSTCRGTWRDGVCVLRGEAR